VSNGAIAFRHSTAKRAVFAGRGPVAIFVCTYIDSAIEKVRRSRAGCEIKLESVGIIVYADDILLVAPTVIALQLLFKMCENELNWLAMSISASKSACLRIGKDYKTVHVCIRTIDGREYHGKIMYAILGCIL